MIPWYRADGTLPPGIHWAGWEEIKERFAHNPFRSTLLVGLKGALDELHYAGCRTVYLDGSFVTTKQFPRDYDVCWDDHGVNPSLLDTILVLVGDVEAKRKAQKNRYFGELFPTSKDNPGILEFFHSDRDFNPKGIVALDLRGWQ